MSGVVKRVLDKVEYTTDDPNDSPTWTEIPVIKLHGDTDPRMSEAQTVETINGLQAQAAERIEAAYIVIVDDDDVFLDDIKTAANNWSPIWFRETPQGQNARILGGTVGGAVTWGRELRQFGDVECVAVGFTATGANPDDAFEIETGGS